MVTAVGRTDEEPVYVGEYETYDAAEAAWSQLVEADIAAAIVTSDPPWGRPIHRVQVARKVAGDALRLLAAAND